VKLYIVLTKLNSDRKNKLHHW